MSRALLFRLFGAWQVWQAMRRGDAYAETAACVVTTGGRVYDVHVVARMREGG